MLPIVDPVRFSLGEVVVTPGTLSSVPKSQLLAALTRHATGDWGELDEQDWKANDEALEYGARLLSAYSTADGIRFWIITEHDRSVTTLLLPLEY